MKKNFLLSASLVIFAVLLSSTSGRNDSIAATVTITTASLDKTSASGVTIRYIIKGLEVKTINGIDHGSCLNTSTNPQLGKDGSTKSTGVGGTVDSKGKPAPAGTFYCASYTRNLKTGVKYYVRPYVKLSDGTILYGSEKSITLQ